MNRGLLQFYFDMGARDSVCAAQGARATKRTACASRRATSLAAAVIAVALASCATTPPSAPVPSPAAPAAPPLATPPPPPVNLQGFPLAYRQGFGDGCSTARGTERKDATRFGSDGSYRVGWQDGVAQCKAR